MSDLCQKCIDRSGAAQYRAAPPMSEGRLASGIGVAIMWTSVAAALVCIFAFGRIEIPYGTYGTKRVWSPAVVITCIGLGVNGVFFGFLLSKVGSALQHLEKLRGGR